MPEITVIMFDNALSSQNQDYLPSRIVLQKEIIDSIITRSLEADAESLVGLIPFAQKSNNNILTPTKTRPYLTTFLHKIDLHPKINYYSSLYQADLSLHVTELSSKNLVIFFSSPLQNEEEILSNLYTIASKGIIIKVVCFGDAIDLGNMLKKEIDFENFGCLCLDTDDNFNENVLSFLGGSMNVSDPELEEAIRRSLQQ